MNVTNFGIPKFQSNRFLVVLSGKKYRGNWKYFVLDTLSHGNKRAFTLFKDFAFKLPEERKELPWWIPHKPWIQEQFGT